MIEHVFHALADSRVAKRLATRTPVTRSMSRRFVPGESIEDALEATARLNEDGTTATLNYLGEAVESAEHARKAGKVYLELLDRIRDAGVEASISIKPTQVGLELDGDLLLEIVRPVVGRAAEHGNFVRFDMEHSEHVDPTLDFFRVLWEEGRRNIGIVLQAYLRRTEADARRSVEWGAPVRLCKGAYEEPAEIAFTEREEIDASFVRLAEILLDGGHDPAIATHDEAMIRATREYAEERGIPRDAFEFQMLYGVRRDLQEELRGEGFPVRVYIPFGDAWYEYLMRRLAERPANVGFLAASVVKESPLGRIFGNRRKGAGG